MTSRAQSVTVLGIEPKFWSMDTTNPEQFSLGVDEIAINQSLADELNAALGDKLILRIGRTQGIAADSPLARKTDLVQSIVDLEIVRIVPTRGLARFSLQASQQIPANAFVSLETLQLGLEQENKANALFIASDFLGRAASGLSLIHI